MDFLNILLDNGVMLILVVIGLIEACNVIFKLELKDNRILFCVSIAMGLLVGFFYEWAYVGIPQDVKGWFDVAALALILGLLSPYIHKAADGLLQGAADKVVRLLKELIDGNEA